MLNFIKTKVAPILLILSLVFTTIIFVEAPTKAYALEKGSSTFSLINPIYEDLLSEEEKAKYLDGRLEALTFETPKVYKAKAADSFDPDLYASNVEEAADVLRDELAIRNQAPTVYIKTSATASEADLQNLCGEIYFTAIEHTGNPKEGDSLKFATTGLEAYIGWLSDGTTLYVTYNYNVGYYTNASQEAALDSAVNNLKANLNVDDKSDYEKVKAIYDYMTENITYDYDNLEDDSYLLKYTAYAALVNKTSVCQGYATLFYRLALEYGIDARIIAGVSNEERHAWNIVKLDGKYYLLDATWDAGEETYSYFLKGTDNWTKHDPDSEYATTQFKTAHPISAKDYTAPVNTGATVSGKVTSFLETDEYITVQLLNEDGTVAYSTVVDNYTVVSSSKKEYTTSFNIPKVAAGKYTLVVSKPNHVAREYSITVSGSKLTQDAKIQLKGDVTGDGKINSLDKKKVYNHIKGTKLTGYDFDIANINGDTKINSLDKKMIYNHIKGTLKLW